MKTQPPIDPKCKRCLRLKSETASAVHFMQSGSYKCKQVYDFHFGRFV